MARKEKADAQQIVTDAVIAYLEAFEKGEMDSTWVRPWEKLFVRHYCPATGKSYEGFVNTLALSVLAWQRGFTSTAWGTFKQWKEMGENVSVRKGAKAAYIFVPLLFTKKHADGSTMIDGNGDEIKGLTFKQVAVFNAEDVDGWTEPTVVERTNKVADVPAAEKFLKNLNADFSHGGDRAYYSPAGDHIRMPDPKQFRDTPFSTATEAYYGTKLHEYVHWTGHESRCKRNLANAFGTEAYAEEELVAELGATMLCHEFGISESPRPDHAQYIKSWLRRLKDDKRMIFKACGQAQKAVKWMQDQQPTAKK